MGLWRIVGEIDSITMSAPFSRALVGLHTTKVNPGIGADIVMESVSPIENGRGVIVGVSKEIPSYDKVSGSSSENGTPERETGRNSCPTAQPTTKPGATPTAKAADRSVRATLTCLPSPRPAPPCHP